MRHVAGIMIRISGIVNHVGRNMNHASGIIDRVSGNITRYTLALTNSAGRLLKILILSIWPFGLGKSFGKSLKELSGIRKGTLKITRFWLKTQGIQRVLELFGAQKRAPKRQNTTNSKGFA